MTKTVRHSKSLLVLLCSVACLLVATRNKSYAQNPLYSVDSQLRVFFSPICLPDTAPNFLHEMAAHVIGDSFFTDNCPDTTEMDTWFKLFEEMRNMAFDTTLVPRHDSVHSWGTAFFKDTIMMNIMAYNYYRLHDSALTTDSFFDFDPVNFTISDKFPCEFFPFVHHRVFSAAPSAYYLPYKEVTYRVDDNFFFRDQWNDIVNNGWILEIDFGDGMGWQNIPGPNSGSPFHYDAIYSTSGPAYIHTRVFNPHIAAYIMSSVAEVYVPERSKPKEPSYKVPFDGALLSIYFPCEESGEPLNKNIIVLEGYDPKNNFFGNRTAGEVYQDMIISNGLEDLRNFGYTYVVVDWTNSKRDIALNAQTLIDIIDWLKCEQQITADTGTHEQFVIIAESMGGLVARYAMCYMEQNPFTSGTCLLEKMHNTRLLITFDSPHDGANIPLAYQHLYRDMASLLTFSPSITQISSGMLSNLLIDGTAVKQMLIHHVDTKNPFTNTYTEHPDRTAFKLALGSLGNYPQYCKMVAIANGSMAGQGQTNIMTGNQRPANDYFLDYDNDFYVSILGHEIQLAGMNFELRSSPSGSGNLMTLVKDVYRPTFSMTLTITPRWPWPPRINVRINVGSAYWFSTGLVHNVANMDPIDVIPGSPQNHGNGMILTTPTNGANGFLTQNAMNIFFGRNSPTFNPVTGVWSFQTLGAGVGRGTNGTRNLSNASLYTDGVHFCYIPVYSALDYTLPSGNYYTDIISENINTKVASTPFDVIAGNIVVAGDNVYRFNFPHVGARNDLLGSWYGGNPSSMFQRYDSCQDNPHPNFVRFLNREIGDDTLWVNNRTAAWSVLYDAEKFIGVDHQNPYYEHPNLLTQWALRGIYSKEDPYNNIDGLSIFMVRHDTNNIDFLNWPVLYPVYKDTIDWVKCCGEGEFKPGRQEPTTIAATQQEYPVEGGFILYPNPYIDGELMIKLQKIQNGASLFALYDMMGRCVFQREMGATKTGQWSGTVRIDKSTLAPGTYFAVVKDGTNLYKRTLVIQ